ncbi:hypothetical protein RSSM_03761 [Rhodopirellula sallentina SM41]|uniref:Uncharacterized protein n=2 Tax=Rhodopirellula TaxID=265488 RepID=M5TZZ9_9BACT|nr:hypothetical protein RSSM_03761 [Rhodopirellula sallentina SM41]
MDDSFALFWILIMKLTIAIVVLFVAGFIGIDFVSKYAMGGVEAGLPGGGDGKYAEYHEDNLFSYYLSDFDSEYKPSWFGSEDDEEVPLTRGQVTNPFASGANSGVGESSTETIRHEGIR